MTLEIAAFVVNGGSVTKFSGGSRAHARSTTWKVFERERVPPNLHI